MCARCGEEISNERKVYLDDQALCLACAGEQHCYQVGNPSLPAAKDRSPLRQEPDQRR